jgi:hypothetical protein
VTYASFLLLVYDGVTVTVTDTGMLICPRLSVTVRLNARDVWFTTIGAVNVGVAVFAPIKLTVGPEVWTQEYDTIWAPLVVEKLLKPFNVTRVLLKTVEEGDTVATATGGDWVGFVNGTQTPFCSMDPIGHVMLVGTHTPFCRTVPLGQVLDIGTQTPFCSTEFGPQMLEFSMIIQRFDCLNTCLPLPKIAWPLFSQGCAKVGEMLKVNSIPNSNTEAIINAEGLIDRVFKLYYISNASQR